ncbi:hypothetical protein LCGC14_1862420 [marine sediment metagenome]|uniref:Uncharacterized protein n=1 Tax=marine sediment metagenome TaxID=412755 RepID=A0A0F9GVH4_9ZZZZ
MPSVKHEGFRQLRGDDSNHTFGIVVGEASRAVHVCTADDVGTDWNVSSFTHPTVMIHSATTPATNYLKLYQTGSSGIIDVAGTTVFTLTSSSIATALPIASTYVGGTAYASSGTFTAGSLFGIRVESIFTLTTTGNHKAISGETTYTPATSGYGSPIGVAAKVSLAGNFTGGTFILRGRRK